MMLIITLGILGWVVRFYILGRKCSKVNRTKQDVLGSEENQIENELTNDLLSKNLNVIFILGKLLEVPHFYLKCNLLEYGNPVNWIIICDQCTQITRKAWKLHQKIVQINQELNSIKSTVLDKAKSSSLSPKDGLDCLEDSISSSEELFSNRKQIFRITREFIKNHDYSETNKLVNPFIEGDKHAEYLASQQNITIQTDTASSPQVKYEVEYDDYDPDYFEDDYSSSSPPSPKPPSTLDAAKKANKYAEVFKSDSEAKEYSRKTRPIPKTPGGRLSCEVCGNSYLRKSHLIRHKRVIHKLACTPVLKPKVAYFICKICGKQITTRVGLKHHITITHEKQFKFFCEVCGTGWHNTTTLKIHMLQKHKEDPITKKMNENGERIWKCEVEGCAIQFLRKSTLDKHTEKYHAGEGGGERRHKCEFCDSAFYRRSDLKRHWVVHEKKKQNRAFKCDVCGKGYGSESYLAIHKQSFH